MRFVLMAVTGLSLLNISPALAAPRQIEELCFARAAPIWFNGRGEREAFIANCIADHTPTPPAKRGQYKKPR
jgi:hypothetical protein